MKDNHITEIDNMITMYREKIENYKALKELWVDNQELNNYYRICESKTRSDLRKLEKARLELVS